MNGIMAWVQDKKNLPLLLAGVGLLAAIVILAILVKNKNAAQQTGTDTAAATSGTATAGAPTMGGPMGPPGGMGMMPPPPGGVSMFPGMGGQTAASTTPAAPIEKLDPIMPYRSDPFVEPAPPNGQNSRLVAQVQTLTRPRLAPYPVERTGAGESTVEAPQPTRRLAGVMWNGKVSAILDTNGETDIVYPGLAFTRGNSHVRVESIQPNYVILRTLDTKPARLIRVNLGSGPNTNTGNPTTMPGGMPTMMPGGMPGMPGMPGGMPGMPGGMPMMPGGMPMMPGGMPGGPID